MKVKISDSESIILNETQEKIIAETTQGMLSGKFAELVKPFIDYDKKRFEQLGLECKFGYSLLALAILGKFSGNYESLKKQIDDSFGKIEKEGIKKFVNENCEKICQLYKELFSPQLKNTDFFKKTLKFIKRVGSECTKEVIIPADPANSIKTKMEPASESELSSGLANCLQSAIWDSVVGALDNARSAIKEARTESMQTYCKKLIKQNQELKDENTKLKAERAERPNNLELVLESGTVIGISPQSSPKSAKAELVMTTLCHEVG